MNNLKITVVSDTHYYSKKNGISGAAFEQENNRSTNLIKDSEEVLKAFFDQIINDKTNNIVLISGDLTKNGEPDSHYEFIKLLRKLKENGKRVYALPDYVNGIEQHGSEKRPYVTDQGSLFQQHVFCIRSSSGISHPVTRRDRSDR